MKWNYDQIQRKLDLSITIQKEYKQVFCFKLTYIKPHIRLHPQILQLISSGLQTSDNKVFNIKVYSKYYNLSLRKTEDEDFK